MHLETDTLPKDTAAWVHAAEEFRGKTVFSHSMQENFTIDNPEKAPWDIQAQIRKSAGLIGDAEEFKLNLVQKTEGKTDVWMAIAPTNEKLQYFDTAEAANAFSKTGTSLPSELLLIGGAAIVPQTLEPVPVWKTSYLPDGEHRVFSNDGFFETEDNHSPAEVIRVASGIVTQGGLPVVVVSRHKCSVAGTPPVCDAVLSEETLSLPNDDLACSRASDALNFKR